MVGRTPAEAVARFVEPLQRAISCVTPAVLRLRGYVPTELPHALVLADGDVQPLKSPNGLGLRVAQQYRILADKDASGSWKVQTAAYSYVVVRAGQELLAYQWNPSDAGRVTRPHLHIGHGAGELVNDFHRVHLPSMRTPAAGRACAALTSRWDPLTGDARGGRCAGDAAHTQ